MLIFHTQKTGEAFFNSRRHLHQMTFHRNFYYAVELDIDIRGLKKSRDIYTHPLMERQVGKLTEIRTKDIFCHMRRKTTKEINVACLVNCIHPWIKQNTYWAPTICQAVHWVPRIPANKTDKFCIFTELLAQWERQVNKHTTDWQHLNSIQRSDLILPP